MKLIKTRKIIFLILIAIVIFSTGCENVEFGFNKVDGNASTSTPMENGTLKIYDSRGVLLGETTIRNGKYSINIPTYSGTLKLVAVDDKNESVRLEAYSEMNNTKLRVKISPLSNIAAKLIYDLNSTDTDIFKINKEVLDSFNKIKNIDTNASKFINGHKKDIDKIINNAGGSTDGGNTGGGSTGEDNTVGGNTGGGNTGGGNTAPII